ncbi:hypothetical protein PCANC_15115 [Puccinia coronata f. sp. avenae]|uniref:Uncharacterized protein n=1 Tax=Puccinia coronata f. sp. avenae TaxID=200324 RepID=A0A2N5SQY6_9BASI|nr:hypothetical protein PCANC_15115 [Puccinia coronata f. sp. avenae]
MLNLTADPKNEDPPSSVLSDISESDSESNSSQQTKIPDTKLAEVQNRSDNAASRNPSLPPSSMTSSIDDSEITIITPEAFVQNVQEESEVLKDIVLDKTLPLSVCNHMKKALEAMEKSIVAIQNGKSLPAQEEVKVGVQNLPRKRNLSTAASKSPKKTRHKLTSEGVTNNSLNDTLQESTSKNKETQPLSDAPMKTKKCAKTNLALQQISHSNNGESLESATLPLTNPNQIVEKPKKSIKTSTTPAEPSSNQSQTPDAPNGCEDLPVNQGTAQPIQDDVQPNQVILRANQHKNSEPIEDFVQPNQQNVQSKQEKSSSTTSQHSKESTNPDAHLDGEPRPVSSNLRSHGPITKKCHNILKPIHQLYLHTIVYDGFKMALDSITQLYSI